MTTTTFTVAPTADNPRLAAAMVLAAFAVNADLPPADWSVSRDGSLSGTVHTEACFASYLAVLGAEILTPWGGGEQLFTTYMGVHVSMYRRPVTEQVAA